MTTYLLNTTICPCVGLWDVRPLEPSSSLLKSILGITKCCPAGTYVSAIGHESTAAAIEAFLSLGTGSVPVSRVTVAPAVGDRLICFRLKSRPPEGAILDRAQLEAIGFEWVEMTLIAASRGDWDLAQWRQGYSAGLAKGRDQSVNALPKGPVPQSRDERLEPRGSLGGHRD